MSRAAETQGEENMKLIAENIEDIYALTPVQEGMLFYYLKNEDSEYNEQLILNIDGQIDYDLFVKTWEVLIKRHLVLRTIFRWKETKQRLQIVLKNIAINAKFIDLSRENHKFDKYEQYCKNDLMTRFNLEEGAIRFSLYKLEEQKYNIVITNHHIIYDGWSNGILINEFFSVYRALAQKNEDINLPNCMSYKSYVMWLQKRNKEEDGVYWQEYLKNYQSYVQKRHGQNESTDNYILTIEKGPFDKFVKNNNITIAALMNAAWAILIQKIDRRNDIIFGTTTSGRNISVEGIENAVGLFINTVPLRVISKTDMSVMDLVRNIMQDTLKREQFEHTPLTEIKKIAGIGSEHDLFNTIVVVENYPLTQNMNEGDLKVTDYQSFESNNYDITVGVEISDKFKIVLTYKKNIYSETQIKSIAKGFQNVLYSIISNPTQKNEEIELTSIEDKSEILESVNLKSKFPLECGTISDMLSKSFNKYPNNIAVRNQDRVIIYKELDNKSNQLAKRLLKGGVSKNDIVAVLIEPSIEMVIATIAIIKTGAAFILLDTDIPNSRMEYILKDCKAKVLITNREDVDFDVEKLIFNETSIFEESSESIKFENDPNDLLCIIYTSGTTGNPQGVMIEHRNLTTYMKGVFKFLNISSKDSAIQLSAVTFDTFIEIIFLMLLNGGKIVLPKKEDMKNVEELYKLIIEEKVSILSCVPMILNALNRMSSLKDVRIVISGGDVLKYENISNMIHYSEIYNSYGPSEATIGPVYYKVKKNTNKTIPIGKPIEGCKAYILDKDMKLCPFGIVGELYLGGGTISRGYLNNEKLTKERFVKMNICGEEELLYKTGDMALLLQNGDIEFLGRDDGQVKINGVRIELRDIEIQIRKHPKVLDVVADVQKDVNGKQYLCAYFVSEDSINLKELRLHVEELLPRNMSPNYWIKLDRIPETRHGKIDYKALKQHFISNVKNKKNSIEKPSNESEENILKIWCEVLGKEDIGVSDDFFEIGGDSLLLTAVYSRMCQQFEEKITVQELFDYRTIREMAAYLNKKNSENLEKSTITLVDF